MTMKMRKLFSLALIACLLVCCVVPTAVGEKSAAKVKAKSVTISGAETVAKGKTITLNASVNPEGAPQTVTWKSSDKQIATVSSKGVVTGNKAGTAKITATSTSNKKAKATISVTVVEKTEKTKKVKVSAPSGTLPLSQKTMVLTAIATPAGAPQEFSWKSSNKKVATVSSKGIVTAVGAGTVTITATAKDGTKKKGSVKIKIVRDDQANKLSVTVWSDTFNGDAIRAAVADYKANVDKDFDVDLKIVSNASELEDAVAAASASGDYSNLSDIILFQDHSIQRSLAEHPDAWKSLEGASINWKDFGSEKLSYSTEDGVHYGVPLDNGTAIMAYRTDLLAECGYTVEDMTGISWEKFLEVGKKVYEKTGKPLLSMEAGGNDLPYMMLQAEGESQFKNGKANIAGNKKLARIVTILSDMVKENVLHLSEDWSAYNDEILQDQVAGVMNGNWIIPTISQVEENSGKWSVTTLPTLDGNGKEGYASNGGSSLYVTANCKNPELAKDFLAKTFGGSTETYDNALLNGGVITCNVKAGKSDVYNQGIEYFNNQPIYADIVANSAHVPVIEQNEYHYTVRSYVGDAIQAVVEGVPVEEALKEAQRLSDIAMEQ